MTNRERTTRERILHGWATNYRILMNAGEIAATCGVAESTVRKHLHGMVKDGQARYTAYTGLWAMDPATKDEWRAKGDDGRKAA